MPACGRGSVLVTEGWTRAGDRDKGELNPAPWRKIHCNILHEHIETSVYSATGVNDKYHLDKITMCA